MYSVCNYYTSVSSLNTAKVYNNVVGKDMKKVKGYIFDWNNQITISDKSTAEMQKLVDDIDYILDGEIELKKDVKNLYTLYIDSTNYTLTLSPKDNNLVFSFEDEPYDFLIIFDKVGQKVKFV